MSMLSALESDKIAVHEERCISIRNRNAHCIRCLDSCATGAISYNNNELLLDASLCIGCGTCASACPTSAIEVKAPSDEELTKMIKGSIVATKGHPIISCEPARENLERKEYDPEQVCLVPCLGRIDESALVALGAYKAHDVTLLCSECETCPHAPGGKMIREVVPSARNLLEAFGCALPIDLTSKAPERIYTISKTSSRYVANSQGVSRRDFFQSAKEATSKAAQSASSQKVQEVLGVAEPSLVAFQKVNKNGTLSHFVPTRRVRIYNYLKHIGDPVANTINTRIIGSLSIDAKRCNSCRMCAVFCPTGALLKHDKSDEFGIVHRPSACMQCRLCERICPEEAISINSTVSIEQFMGKKALYFAMKKPSWEPNRPSSMYNKIHSVIGDDLEMCSF